MRRIEYDPDVRILKIRFLPGKSVDSDVIGNLVLDYDKDRNLVKIEVMDVNLKDFVDGTNLKKKKTSNIT